MKNRIWENPNNSIMKREKKRIGEQEGSRKLSSKLRGENLKKMSPNLFVFIFVALTFGVESRQSSPKSMSSSLLPMFSIRNFMVSGLTVGL